MATLTQVNLRFPDHVVSELDDLAAQAGLSRSKLVARMIRDARRAIDRERDRAILREIRARREPVYPDLSGAGDAQLAALPRQTADPVAESAGAVGDDVVAAAG